MFLGLQHVPGSVLACSEDVRRKEKKSCPSKTTCFENTCPGVRFQSGGIVSFGLDSCSRKFGTPRVLDFMYPFLSSSLFTL